MKVFVVVLASAAFVAAKPSAIISPFAYAAVPAAITAPVSTQYHAQDELGQYSYGYSSGLSAKAETKTFDGITRGSYSYIDAEGKLQSVGYVSDPVNGFRVAASNLPVAPAVPVVPALPAPTPVVDTAEVSEAKAKHLSALKEAEAAAAAAPEEPAPAPAPAAPAPEASLAAAEANATAKSAAPAAAPLAFPAASVIAGAPIVTYPAIAYPSAAVTSYTTYTAPLATYAYTTGVLPAFPAFAPVAPVANSAEEAKTETKSS